MPRPERRPGCAPPDDAGAGSVSLRRALLLGVAVLVALSAAPAAAILLFGDFGETEGRVLGTAAVLAAHGALVVPATVLLDRETPRALWPWRLSPRPWWGWRRGPG